MRRTKAEILREYGPLEGVSRINGVSYDGRHVWLATGDALHTLDPESGTSQRAIDVEGREGIAARRVRAEWKDLAVDPEGSDAQLRAGLHRLQERGRVVARDPAQVLGAHLRGEGPGIAMRRRAEADRRVEKLAAESEAERVVARH